MSDQPDDVELYAGDSGEEWQERRARGIGASEAAAALGLSQYMTPLELYLRKRRETPPVEETRDMLWGKLVEPAVVKLYEATHDVPLRYPLPLTEHPKHPIVLATGDAELSPTVGVEIKSMQFYGFRRIQTMGLADAAPQFLIQCQQQMAVMGWDAVVLVVLVDRSLHEFTVERDDALIDDVICADLELWQRIESGNPPPIDFSRDDSLRAVQALWGNKHVAGRSVPLSPGAILDWRRAQELAARMKADGEERDRLKAAVLHEIGDAEFGILSDDKVIKRIPIGASTYTVNREPYIQSRECNNPAAPKGRKRPT